MQPVKKVASEVPSIMEIWQRIASSVEPLALEKAAKKVMETAEEDQQDRRQV